MPSRGGFFDFLMVTSLNRIESNGKVEGDKGVLSEKIERAVRREGSWKAEALGGLDEVVKGIGIEKPAGEEGVDEEDSPEELRGREG